MPTEIDVYIEHVISLSKDYSILFDKYIKLEEKCRILEERILLLEGKRTASPALQISFARDLLNDVNDGGGVQDAWSYKYKNNTNLCEGAQHRGRERI